MKKPLQLKRKVYESKTVEQFNAKLYDLRPFWPLADDINAMGHKK